jgi:hypothetical protein
MPGALFCVYCSRLDPEMRLRVDIRRKVLAVRQIPGNRLDCKDRGSCAAD